MEDTTSALVPQGDDSPETTKEGFFRRALNRTKEAFRNVDEAITSRETFRQIDERLQLHEDQQKVLTHSLETTQQTLETLQSRLDSQIDLLVKATVDQQATFERTSNEVATLAKEIKETASAAQTALTLAQNHQLETKQHASQQLTNWQNESVVLKKEVDNLQSQLAQMQQSFRQYFSAIAAMLFVLVAVITYLLLRR